MEDAKKEFLWEEEESGAQESASFSQYDYWSKEKLNILIKLYYQERDLWDTTRSPTFDQRQEAFERIANALGCEGRYAVYVHSTTSVIYT